MMKTFFAAGALIFTALLSGCSSDSSDSTSSATTISGKVADGYLVNATVFLDRNVNYRLDNGEPSTTTDTNGAYTLTLDAGDIGKYPIVALAIKGVTVDKDTNQPVPNSYLMSLPKDAVSGTLDSNFISPISSQVREMMETGMYVTMQQAMEELRTRLGMPVGANLMGDYIAENNSAMHTTAQNVATMMGGHMAQLYTENGSSTNIDVNRYRGMMGVIFSNLSSVKAGDQTTISNLMGTMTVSIGNIQPDYPFRNMSSSFKGMMEGTTLSGGGMMGSYGRDSMMR